MTGRRAIKIVGGVVDANINEKYFNLYFCI